MNDSLEKCEIERCNVSEFPHNIKAIMAEIKLPKKPHSMAIFLLKVRRYLIKISADKLTPREITELEVIHISIKTHVSR